MKQRRYGGFFKENPKPATRIFGNFVYEIFATCGRAVERSGLIKLMNLCAASCVVQEQERLRLRTFSGGILGIIRCVQCIKQGLTHSEGSSYV